MLMFLVQVGVSKGVNLIDTHLQTTCSFSELEDTCSLHLETADLCNKHVLEIPCQQHQCGENLKRIVQIIFNVNKMN